MNERRERLNREIRRRIHLIGVSPKKLSLDAGLSETAVKDILSGKSANPKHDTLEKIARKLGCTVGDLTGERSSRRSSPENDANTVTINELDVHVTAGQSLADDAGGLMAANEASHVLGVHTYPIQSFREAFAVDPGKVRILAVRGDSMEPRLWAGQRVMVDIEDKTPSPPGIFVVWDGLGLVIKRVEVVPGSDPLRVRIMSANPAYAPYERTLEEAHINGRVIGTWSRT